MTQYRKKPTIVEAVQWDGTQGAVADIKGLCKVEIIPELNLYLFTSAGLRICGRGYWVVQDSDEHINVYHPIAFSEQFEPI